MALAIVDERRLTPHQREILRELAHGYSNKEIATHLNISHVNVLVQTTRMRKTLGTANFPLQRKKGDGGLLVKIKPFAHRIAYRVLKIVQQRPARVTFLCVCPCFFRGEPYYGTRFLQNNTLHVRITVFDSVQYFTPMEKRNHEHDRAPGMVAMSISMPLLLKTRIEKIAKEDDQCPSAWARSTLFKVANRSLAARRKDKIERQVSV